MVRIEIKIKDEEGKEISEKKEYKLDIGEKKFDEIEEAVEKLRKEALKEIEAELLKKAQEEYIKEHEELGRNGTRVVKIKGRHGQVEFKEQRFIDKEKKKR